MDGYEGEGEEEDRRRTQTIVENGKSGRERYSANWRVSERARERESEQSNNDAVKKMPGKRHTEEEDDEEIPRN